MFGHVFASLTQAYQPDMFGPDLSGLSGGGDGSSCVVSCSDTLLGLAAAMPILAVLPEDAVFATFWTRVR